MEKQSMISEEKLATVDFGAPVLSDAVSAAEAALVGATSFAAGKTRLSRAEVAIALKQNDSAVRSYFQYGLAKQVAEHLAALDEQITAVYMYDDEATPEDAILGADAAMPLIHLIVLAKRRTNALNSLVTALDRALVRGYAGLASMPNLAHLLDVQIVSEEESKQRTGYAALLSSLHHQPLTIWQR
jgi:hypothetical protein